MGFSVIQESLFRSIRNCIHVYKAHNMLMSSALCSYVKKNAQTCPDVSMLISTRFSETWHCSYIPSHSNSLHAYTICFWYIRTGIQIRIFEIATSPNSVINTYEMHTITLGNWIWIYCIKHDYSFSDDLFLPTHAIPYTCFSIFRLYQALLLSFSFPFFTDVDQQV